MSKSKKVQEQTAVPMAKPAQPPVVSGGVGVSDVIVILAMATAAVALGFGLYLQAGWGMIPAGGAAAAAFVTATFMHTQLMRIRSLQQAVEGAVVPTAVVANADASEPVSDAGAPRLSARREPSLRPPKALVDAEVEDLDRTTDQNAGQLSLVAAALRDAEPAARAAADRRRSEFGNRGRTDVAPEPALELGGDEAGGWTEPGAVDALVRQYAEELDRGAVAPDLPRSPQPALPERPVPMPRLPGVVQAAAAESSLSAAIRKGAEGGVEIHLQPVVAFADRKARLYEVFPKLVDAKGRVLSFSDYQPAAIAMGLALAIERAVVLRCCAIQRRLSERGRARAMIIKLSPAAIRDRAFLQRLLADMQADPLLADLLIFEVDQAEIEQGDGAERENMDLLARAGFRFALGAADTLALEVEELTVRRIGFVRIAADLLAAEGNPAAVGDLRRGAVETILTGVVTEDHARLGQEFGLVLGQGALFSEAKPLRADVAPLAAQTRNA